MLTPRDSAEEHQPTDPRSGHGHLVKPRYRGDIDGLRAIAVLAVLGYHAFPSAVPGGFVGVDVFFVISGFLITSIIAGSLASGDFTFGEFYARRIRRIFPALAVVLAASIAIGWFTLVPGDYATLGKHVVGGALFVSNVVLWQESGYFDAAAQFKPLLHLWSLGIEEQFYLLWPPLLLAATRLRIGAAKVTWMLAVLSLVGSLVLIGRDPSAAFYLPFTRFWELLLGALLAHRALAHGVTAAVRGNVSDIARGRGAEVAAWLGVAMLGWAILGFDGDAAFPGWRALVPTLGTGLLIAAGAGTFVARRVLSLRALVAIGLISYPLYLWHWPLLSFARIYSGDEIAPLWRAALLATAVVLAWGTYAWVESPFRFRLPRRRAITVLSLAMVAIAALGAGLMVAGGFPSRAGEPVRRYVDYHYEFRAASREGTCSLVDAPQPLEFPASCIDPPRADARPPVVLWGDSHAAMLYPGLRAISEERAASGEDFRIAQFTRSGCRPFLDVGYDLCRRGNAAVLRTIARTRPDDVVLFANWNHLKFRSGEQMLRELEPTIAALKRLGVPRIIVVGPAPQWKGTLPADLVRLYDQRPFLRVPSRTRHFLDPDPIALDAFLQRTLGQRRDITYFSALRALCDGRGCLTYIGDDPGILTTWDYGHLSRPAATYVARRLAGEVEGFARAAPRPPATH